MSTRKNEATWVEARERWQINVQSDGERKTFVSSKEGKKGKIEAERKADEWLEEKSEKDIRFEKLWEQFLEFTKSMSKFGEKSETYIKHEQLGRLWVLPYLKHKKVSSVSCADYQKCITSAYQAGKSKRTCQNIRGSLTALYNYARSKKMKIEKPEYLKIPTDAPVGKRKILQPTELNVLFSNDTITHYNKQVKCIYIYAWRFLVVSGLRRGELCAIQKTDIKNNVLDISKSFNRNNLETAGKTRAAQRNMYLSECQQSILNEQKEMLESLGIKSKWVFCDEDGERVDPNSLYKKWLTYRNQHNLHSSLHELRHTFISIVKSDMPQALLKKFVGHTDNMDTYGVYGHEVDGDMERTANIIDDVFNKLLL